MSYYALFENVRAAIEAGKLCRTAGFAAAAVPVPESITSECTICLKFNDIDGFTALVDNTRFRYTIYEKI